MSEQQPGEERQKRAVVVLGSAANPPHQGHLHCLQVGKKQAETLGYEVLFTTLAIAPYGYVKRKQPDFCLSDETRLQILKLLTDNNDDDDDGGLSFLCPDRAYGSALECGKAMRPDDSVAVVIVVGGDRAKNKWRKAPKAQQHGTIISVCCARDPEQWQNLQDMFAQDEKEGLVQDPNYYFAMEVGPRTSSTVVRSILCQEDSSEEEKIAALEQHGYSRKAATFLMGQVPASAGGASEKTTK